MHSHDTEETNSVDVYTDTNIFLTDKHGKQQLARGFGTAQEHFGRVNF